MCLIIEWNKLCMHVGPITIRHCANDLVILNKVVLYIVSETVKAVCKSLTFTICGEAFKVLGKLFLRHVFAKACFVPTM